MFRWGLGTSVESEVGERQEEKRCTSVCYLIFSLRSSSIPLSLPILVFFLFNLTVPYSTAAAILIKFSHTCALKSCLETWCQSSMTSWNSLRWHRLAFPSDSLQVFPNIFVAQSGPVPCSVEAATGDLWHSMLVKYPSVLPFVIWISLSSWISGTLHAWMDKAWLQLSWNERAFSALRCWQRTAGYLQSQNVHTVHSTHAI